MAADQGNAEAQNQIGLMYVKGRGVVQSKSEAITWFQLAARQGLAKAQFNLGFMYQTAMPMVVDCSSLREAQTAYTEAKRWYQKAIEQGNKAASYKLQVLEAQAGSLSSEHACDPERSAPTDAGVEGEYTVARLRADCTGADPAAQIACSLYIRKIFNQADQRPRVCPPEGTQTGDAVDAVILFLKKNRFADDYPATSAIALALEKAYPCKAGN